MQYILSQEEMDSIRNDREALRKAPDPEALKNVCMHVACTMITTVDTNGHGKNATAPHGCVHAKENPTWYCDRCPVAGICPLPKQWSK